MGGAHLARWPRTRAARFATETGPGEPFGFSGTTTLGPCTHSSGQKNVAG